MILNDSVIRARLKKYLLGLPVKPRTVIDELHVHKGNAIADVVAIYKEPHCYEIKGETDNISRLKVQGSYYDLVFKRISLVTTENHLTNAIKTTPSHWGIIVASIKDGEIKLKHFRKTKKNPSFDKEIALYTLWRQEMLNVSAINKIELPKKVNKQVIANTIASKLSVNEVNASIADSLLNRLTSTKWN